MPSQPNARRTSTRREIDAFDAAAANRDMASTLQRKRLQGRARAAGLELRQSAFGYSLIDAGRERVDGRNDLTLDEVEGHLNAAASGARSRSSRRA
jgi:hypothetical protein